MMKPIFDPRRPSGRFFYCLISVLLAVIASRAQAPATTVINDVVYRASGAPASGTLVISWAGFTTADNKAVPAGGMSVTIGAQGVINLALAPNEGASPAGSFYRVVYKLSDGATSTEYWVVPRVSPATIGGVRATVAPSQVAARLVSQQSLDAQLATKVSDALVVHKSGDETIQGLKTFAAAPAVPAPATGVAVANKDYVDAAVSSVMGELVRKSGDSMTGPLTLPADPVASDHAANRHYVDVQVSNVVAGMALKVDRFNGAPVTMASVRYADQFPSIQAAIDDLPANGGTVFIPAGTFTTSTITMPGRPKRVVLKGAGIGATVLIPDAANIPVLKAPSSGTQADGDWIGDFSIKAHASGSTGPAIDMPGFRYTTFENIEYQSNGAGNFNQFFHCASTPLGAFGNVIRHPVVALQSGPPTVFLFDNGGTGNALINCNENYIYDSWINANTGINIVFDIYRTALMVVSGGLVEGNTGAIVVKPGTRTVFEKMWMELNASPITVQSVVAADGSSNSVTFRDNYISNPQTIDLVSGVSNWSITGNMPSVNLTVNDAAGGSGHIHWQLGNEFLSANTKGEVLFTNTLAGGKTYAIQSTPTAGTFGQGLFIGEWAAARPTIQINSTRSTMFSPAANGQALRLVPFDDTIPGNLLFSVTDTAQSLTKAFIRQNGDASFSEINANGGITINSTAVKPACGSSIRGKFWVTQSATGVKDAVEVCAKDAANAYAWRTIY